MWWQKQARHNDLRCVVPQVVGTDLDGPACGEPLEGGAILINLDGRRTPICHQHMAAVFQGIVAAIESAVGAPE